MHSLNILKDNKYKLSYLYLFLSILGAILTMMANFDFVIEYGNSFDLKSFISLSNANPAAQSISRDLLVGASAVFIWIINEAKKLNIKRISLETGAGKFFDPARKLFKKCSFKPCEPFAHYKDDINSLYLTKLINND